MDVYTKNRHLLNNQPKSTIGKYVEDNGFLVPRRFETESRARRSGIEIICRSELLQDYDGFSGVLDSPDLENWIQGEFDYLTEERISDYSKIKRITRNEFIEQISYSFWEKIDGLNRSIIADTSVKGRYHLFTSGDNSFNYTIWDNGKIKLDYPFPLKKELVEQIPSVIDFYENIRHLPNFDSNHCPMIEFQTLGDKNYFLQYHRTRDFEECTFTLDREIEPGEIEVQYSRGSTPEEGVIINFQRFNIHFENMYANSSGYATNGMIGEFMAKEYELLMSGLRRESLAFHTSDHVLKSALFKPPLFISDHKFDPSTQKERLAAMLKTRRNPSLILPIRVISDGRKTYVKRV